MANWWRPSSLRGRLLASYLLIIILALGTVVVLALFYLEHGAVERERHNLSTHAGVVAGVSAQYIVKQHDYLEYIARDYGRLVGARVLLLDRQGRVLRDSFYETAISGADLSGREEVAAALAGRPVARVGEVDAVGRTLYAAAPILDQGEVAGAVLIARGLESIFAGLDSVRRILYGVTGAALSLAAVAGWLLASSLARPVTTITSGVRAVEGGDLGQRVPVRGTDELGQLAQAFNRMAERLARMEESRKAFVANAAHELRTPLAALRALTEPLLSGAVTRPEEVADFLQDIGQEVDRLSDLAGDLLTLSELEAGRPLQLDPVDLGAVLERVRTRLLPLGRELGVEISAPCPAGARVRADGRSLERAVYNLVHNAVTFSPRGGSVLISCERGPAGYLVAVSDQGPGIPTEDLPHIFERFYRSERSRSRERGGAGLGLAIASEILIGHGGQIRVESQAGEGTRFVAELPAIV